MPKFWKINSTNIVLSLLTLVMDSRMNYSLNSIIFQEMHLENSRLILLKLWVFILDNPKDDKLIFPTKKVKFCLCKLVIMAYDGAISVEN